MLRAAAGRVVVVLALLAVGLAAPPAGAAGETCLGLPATIVGTPGNDKIEGTPGDDVIAALGGDDLVMASGGDDTICGGDGNDTASFASAPGAVTASLVTGTATGDGTDTLDGFENLTGGSRNDRLTGDAAGNRLDGGSGTDTCRGGAGDDAAVGCESATATYGVDDTVETFTFTVAPRTVRYLRIAGPNGRLTLTGPTGTLVDRQPTSYVTDPMTLTLPGTYTATVTAFLWQNYDYTVTWTTAPSPQAFDLAPGQTVTGTSASGPGNLEKPGSTDLYRISGVAGQRLYPRLTPVRFSGQPGFCPDLTLTGAPGVELLPGTARCGAAGVPATVTLPANGTFVLGVRSGLRGHVGTYTLALLAAPPAQAFAYDPGTPTDEAGPGAGALEQVGSVDEYRFAAGQGQRAYLYGTPPLTLTAPSGAPVVPSTPSPGYPAQVTLPEAGEYLLRVHSGETGFSGAYSLRLYLVQPPQDFDYELGQPIEQDVPGPGAGHLFGPEAVDRYAFSATAGQPLVVQVTPSSQAWTLTDPAGKRILRRGNVAWTPTRTGRHVLTFGPADPLRPDTHYTARIDPAPKPQQFDYALGSVVIDGVPEPGAGRLESAASQDWFTFDGTSGQTLIMDWRASGPGLRWQLVSRDGTVVVPSTTPRDRYVSLPATDTYTVRVTGVTADVVFTGPFSFRLF